jgi:hypothetical protein
MTNRPDEVQASVDLKVTLLTVLQLLLLNHICLMLVINKVDNRQPGIMVIDIVSKARSVNNSKLVKLLVVVSVVVFHSRQLC